MQISLLTIRYPPARGGGESLAESLADILVRSGHEVIVETTNLASTYPWRKLAGPSSGIRNPEVGGNLKIHRHRAVRMLYPPVPGILFHLFTNKPSLVIAINIPQFHTESAALYSKLTRRPFVVIPIGAHLHHPPDVSVSKGRIRQFLSNMYMRTLARMTMSTATLVLCLTQDEVDFYEKWMPALKARLCLLPTPLETGRFKRASPPQPDKPFVVCYLGRFARGKGLESLVDAVGILHDEGRNVRLTLVGSDFGLETSIREMCRARRLDSIIQVRKDVTEAEKVEILSESHCIALPSYYESFGISIMEGFAAGLPAIATERGGMKFLVQDGFNGAIVRYDDASSLADAIRKLSEKDRWHRTSLNALHSVMKYDSTEVSKYLVGLINGTVSKREPDRRNSAI